jgi:hypothetical protein
MSGARTARPGILNTNQMVSKFYVRIDGIKDKAALKDLIAQEFGNANCYENPEKPSSWSSSPR